MLGVRPPVSLGMSNAARPREPRREAREEVVELLSGNTPAPPRSGTRSCPIGIGASDRYARRLRDARQHLSHLLGSGATADPPEPRCGHLGGTITARRTQVSAASGDVRGGTVTGRRPSSSRRPGHGLVKGDSRRSGKGRVGRGESGSWGGRRPSLKETGDMNDGETRSSGSAP